MAPSVASFFFFFQKVISSKTAPPHSQLTRNIFGFIFLFTILHLRVIDQ